MKVFIHQYSLSTNTPFNALEAQTQAMGKRGVEAKHEGFLFQIHFPDQSWGFSSLHLHPSLGDETVESFLRHLKEHGKAYLLTHYPQVILNATADAKGQAQRFLHEPRVRSHYTSTNSILSQQELRSLKERGFQRIKIKVGTTRHSLSQIIAHYKVIPETQEFDWIFDFNLLGELKELKATQVQNWKRSVYFEDPTPYRRQDWKNLVTLGFKLISDQVPFAQIIQDEVRVEAIAVKPTKIDMLDALENTQDYKLMVTSNMGEDLDILTSWYWAQYVQKEKPDKFFGAGFLTQDVYLPNPYIHVSREMFAEQAAAPFEQMECSAEQTEFSIDLSTPKPTEGPLTTDYPIEFSSGWGRAPYLKTLEWTEV